ncbi:MAG TPA: hypothetical protein VGK96_10445 [Candidatus Sulfotelmatobacter sp.]|jgi:hypothetical protein
MDQNPKDQNTCDVCEQPFSSEQELKDHKDNAHGRSNSADKQSNYDIERDQPQERKIA